MEYEDFLCVFPFFIIARFILLYITDVNRASESIIVAVHCLSLQSKTSLLITADSSFLSFQMFVDFCFARLYLLYIYYAINRLKCVLS